MNVSQLETLPGKWTGESRLFLEGNVYDSESTAEVHYVGQGQFISLSYIWAVEGEPQDGQIVFRTEIGESPSKAVWLDSWHMANDIMVCEGTTNEEGFASLHGTYAAPPGPDWGWRIEVGTSGAETFIIRMFVITPDGQEGPAVLARYERVAAAD